MPTSLIDTIQLVIVALVRIVVVGFLYRIVFTITTLHPLMRSFVRYRTAKTRACVDFTDGKFLEQFFINVITSLQIKTVNFQLMCVCLLHTSRMLMSFFKRPSIHCLSLSLRSSCLNKKPDVNRPRRSGRKRPVSI